MRVLVDTETFSVTSTIKKTPPTDGVFLNHAKKIVLGGTYQLSLAFVGTKKIQDLNFQNRKINKATDILSFPLEIGKNGVGEIYICMKKVVSKAKKFETTPKKYLEYLLVHGMVHLLGYDHGPEMDKLEKKYTQKLNISYPYQVY